MVSKEEKKMSKEVEKILREAKRNVRKKNYENAASLYKKASLLAHKIGDKKAVEYALEAVKYNLKIKNYFNAGWSYRNAAIFSKDFRDFDNAISFAMKAIDYFSKTDCSYAVQWCYNLAGEASEERKDYFSAARYYRKSLEIERKEAIEKRLERILKEAPHPTIEQTPDRQEVKEGGDVTFKIRIKNDSKNVLNDICIFDKKGDRLCLLEGIEPGNERLFSLGEKAHEVGMMDSPFKRIRWKVEGKEFEDDVEPLEIPVKPNIEIRPYIKNKPHVGSYSYFVISVKNNSSSPVTDVKLSVNFPIELKVKPVTGYFFREIQGNEEKGFVFKILPTIVGKTRIEPEIRFRDMEGVEHREKTRQFLLEEVIEPPEDIGIRDDLSKPLPKEDFERVKKINELKKYVSSVMVPFEISEPEYVSLTKRFFHVTRGYMLKGVDVESVSKHVLEECREVKLVGSHEFEDEKLYLFAGESAKEKRIYLLTVVVKEDERAVHLAFKLYSDKKEDLENFLSKIAEIIKHTIVIMSLAREVERIEVKKTINIIDSIVQRSDIGTGEGKDKEIKVKDSVVQRTEL
ncbi:MAG: hypothetical protein GTN38_00655 [Candidatus Aenigmarchaeota archaeon]|nr:hypothetical protein [Candidatus Aenigmarchaeota archaeon]NIP40096.1 hypothetical protein [Candidatus Aenigmarchaeota archaeon]NIQ18173.1 hypothetical protein [Candidatus Aenigmarchaeota archaeon]NIS72930.1 hypothetical protein [Candidatus Aenigmarchaeota archaeon]